MVKKFTLNDLAVMVKRGFDQTATKEDVNALEQRIGALEQRTGALEQRIGALEQRTGALEQRVVTEIATVNRRIDLLRDDLSDIPDIRETVQDLDRRMDRVERKVGLTQR